MVRLRILPNLPPVHFQTLVEIALEKLFNGLRHVRRITRLAKISSLTFDDLFAERANVRGNHRKAVAISQEQNAALKDFLVGQNQNVPSLEVQLHLLIGNKFDSGNDAPRVALTADDLLNHLQILLGTFFRLARNDQAVVFGICFNLFERFEKILQSLVRPDSPKKQNRFFLLLNAQLKLGFGGCQRGIQESKVEGKEDDCNGTVCY